MSRSIYLVGFMGAGKTTVGRLLAASHDLPFRDLDEEIVRGEGASIAQLFQSAGEAGFRQLECRYLESLAGPAVVALGGGAFMTAAIREWIADHGVSVYLRWSADELWRRVADDPARPLARDEQAFRRLLAEREPVYQQADFWVLGGSPPRQPDELTEAISSLLASGERTMPRAHLSDSSPDSML